MKPIAVPGNIKTYLCPECNNVLKLRSGTYGDFYGCSNFPRCKKIIPVGRIEEFEESKIRSKIKVDYNSYQDAIFEAIGNSTHNIITRACAGSGKTFTLENCIQHISNGQSIKYLVFNKRNVEEAKLRMPSRCSVQTTHSFGLGIIRKYYPSITVDSSKVSKLTYDMTNRIISGYGLPHSEHYKAVSQLASDVRATVAFLKNMLSEPTEDNIQDIIETFSGIYILPISRYYEDFIKLVSWVYRTSAQDTASIDFDDMLFFPWYHNLPISKTDYILADEIQDFNAAQIHLLFGSVGERVIGVGDEAQSIYGFRAAQLDAMDVFEKEFNCINLPLSMTFRVPITGVDNINEKYPEIPFEAWGQATEGIIENQSERKFLSKVEDGSLIMCRTNAPLVSPVYKLIRGGRKANIIGKNMGQGLVKWLESTGFDKVPDALKIIGIEVNNKIDYFVNLNKPGKVASIKDRFDTLVELCQGTSSVSEAVRRINIIFTEQQSGINFSTVHRAKGAEADNVYVLKPELMPLGFASNDWERQQERNIEYVADSRFKQKLVYIKS